MTDRVKLTPISVADPPEPTSHVGQALDRDDSARSGQEPDLPFLDHPLATPFPLLEGPQFDALVADIRRHGLNEPIVLLEGKVLDGRSRMRACVLARVPCQTVPFQGADAISYLISVNLRRRHLSASERASIAAEFATMPVGRPKEIAPNGAITQAAAAKLLGVSRRSVQRAVAVLERGKAGVVPRVKTSWKEPSAAVVKRSKASQGTPVAEADMEPRTGCDEARASHAANHATQCDLDIVSGNAEPRTVRSNDNAAGDWLSKSRAEQLGEWILDRADPDDLPRLVEWVMHSNPMALIKTILRGRMLPAQDCGAQLRCPNCGARRLPPSNASP